MREMFLTSAKILENTRISKEIFSMRLDALEIAKTARAGQFIMVYLEKGKLLLPRPISLCNADAIVGEIEIVYQVVGKGTKVLSEMAPGQSLKLLGALGNGFSTDDTNIRVALVGGGIGVPPLFLLAKTLAERGVKIDAHLGFRSLPILVERFQSVADNVYIATEDGSVGHSGFVTEVLQEKSEQNGNYDEIFACGPKPLLHALAEFSLKKNIPCQVCMEERMACGIGTCVGCVVNVGDSYIRVCTEGPVFSALEVNWHE